MRILISKHAWERYRERVKAAAPLSEVRKVVADAKLLDYATAREVLGKSGLGKRPGDLYLLTPCSTLLFPASATARANPGTFTVTSCIALSEAQQGVLRGSNWQALTLTQQIHNVARAPKTRGENSNNLQKLRGIAGQLSGFHQNFEARCASLEDKGVTLPVDLANLRRTLNAVFN